MLENYGLPKGYSRFFWTGSWRLDSKELGKLAEFGRRFVGGESSRKVSEVKAKNDYKSRKIFTAFELTINAQIVAYVLTFKLYFFGYRFRVLLTTFFTVYTSRNFQISPWPKIARDNWSTLAKQTPACLELASLTRRDDIPVYTVYDTLLSIIKQENKTQELDLDLTIKKGGKPNIIADESAT
jgi:hypothetical protein